MAGRVVGCGREDPGRGTLERARVPHPGDGNRLADPESAELAASTPQFPVQGKNNQPTPFAVICCATIFEIVIGAGRRIKFAHLEVEARKAPSRRRIPEESHRDHLNEPTGAEH